MNDKETTRKHIWDDKYELNEDERPPVRNNQNHNRIPEELRKSGKFCCWYYAWSEKQQKKIKIPVTPSRSLWTKGSWAKVNDPKTFESYDAAEKYYQTFKKANGQPKYDGIGIRVSDGYVGLDFDACIKDGVIDPDVVNQIDYFNSYTEVSPSGKGIRIICKTKDLHFTSKEYEAKYYKSHPLKNTEYKFHREIYIPDVTNRYCSLTGNTLNVATNGLFPDYPLGERTAEVLEFLEKYMRLPKKESATKDATPYVPVPEDELTNEQIIDYMKNHRYEKIKHLWDGDCDDYLHEDGEKAGQPDHSAGDYALCWAIAEYAKDKEQIDQVFRESGMYRDIWDSDHYRNRTLDRVIAKRIEEKAWHYSKAHPYPPDSVEASFGDILSADYSGSQEAKKVLSFLQENNVLNNSRYSNDDVGNGYLLADYAEPVARCIDGKLWMRYDGRCWQEDSGNVFILETAKAITRGFALYAAGVSSRDDMKELLKRAERWTQQRNISSAITMAASVHPISRDRFDADKFTLNVLNGTIDLRTRELRPHSPEDLLTKLAEVEYDPSASCDRWNRFISEIMEPGESEVCSDEAGEETVLSDEQKRTIACEKSKFLQKYLGYCLSGVTKEETFLICYGPTSRNGKSVMTETVHGLLGSYAKSVSPETMIQVNNRNGSSPSEDVARLAKIRLASVGELPQGGRLDSSRVKRFTGNDTVTARFLGQNSFEFKPEFKLLLHTNHLPKVSDMSVFESGRVMLLPFSRHFEQWEQDKGLKEFFQQAENRSGILNWLLDGFMLYEREGLSTPDVMSRAVRQYQSDSDKVKNFIEECLIEDPKGKVSFMNVYDAYKMWCKGAGHNYESSSAFKMELSKRNVHVDKGKVNGVSTTRVCGYSVKADAA